MMFLRITTSLLCAAINQPLLITTSQDSRRVAHGVSASTLPDRLLDHFRSRGIVLRPEARYEGQKTEWIIENADIGPRCEAVTSFVSFPSGVDVAAMRNYLVNVSVASVLNEQAALAMFYPHGRGRTSDSSDCAKWSEKSKGIVDRLLDAFKAYRPADVAKTPDKNR